MTAPGGGGGKGKKHGGECVKVVVRCRPLASKEIADGRQRIVDMDSQTGQVKRTVSSALLLLSVMVCRLWNC
jgi:hypothetical protein